MKKYFLKSFPILCCILIIFIAGLLAFYKTFDLMPTGDDWQMMWAVKSSLIRTGEWNWLLNKWNWQPYQTGALLIHLVTDNFGHDGKAVYIFSYLTRFLAVLALFYFLMKRKLSKKVALLGSLFFMLSPVGLQTTDWVKNFTSYISIAFFLICINSLYNLKSWRSVIVFILTFFISVSINVIRAHGIILTTSFLLVALILFEKNKYDLKFSLLSNNKVKAVVALLVSILSVYFLSGISALGEVGVIQFSGILLGLIQTIDLVRIGELLTLISRGVLPQISLSFLIILVFIFLLWKRYLLSKKYLPFMLLIHILPVILYLWLPSSADGKINAALGFYFTLFLTSTFIIEIYKRQISEAINTIFPFLLNISFVFIPWIFGRTDLTDSTHRYYIFSSLSLPLIVAFTLNKYDFKNFKKEIFFIFNLRFLSFCITLIFLVMFYFSIKSQVNILYNRHNKGIADIIWQQILPYFDNFDFSNHRPIVYFESDDTAVTHDVVTFGFGFHLAYLMEMWDENKLPIGVDSISDLKSLVTDGKASEKYAEQKNIFPKEDAFYFKIVKSKVSKVDFE